jgi:hypothetical protein
MKRRKKRSDRVNSEIDVLIAIVKLNFHGRSYTNALLAKYLGISLKSVKRVLSRLLDDGSLIRTGGEGRTPARYEIVAPIHLGNGVYVHYVDLFHPPLMLQIDLPGQGNVYQPLGGLLTEIGGETVFVVPNGIRVVKASEGVLDVLVRIDGNLGYTAKITL